MIRQDHSWRNLGITLGGFIAFILGIALLNQSDKMPQASQITPTDAEMSELDPVSEYTFYDWEVLANISEGLPGYTSGTETSQLTHNPFTPPPLSKNILKNGNFEQGREAWTTSDGYLGSGYESSTALCINPPQFSPSERSISQRISVTSGASYDFSVWMKWGSMQSASALIIWHDQSDAGDALNMENVIFSAYGDSYGWQHRQTRLSIPPSITEVTISFQESYQRTQITELPHSVFCVDDVILAPVN